MGEFIGILTLPLLIYLAWWYARVIDVAVRDWACFRAEYARHCAEEDARERRWDRP